ncbi:MAG: cell division protein FtsA [Candidatus Marinimicrobia bacterium]|jgi:cell division protein FtsA|nr:cell division protein FtsA [Candidatus Neomarinimicrobiota bacterium]MBT3634173.1 cell division protein FtsA [Candidatus Neomarinimicrobiota bacterium]MBT3683210.1 cell division protein FtsA [Candidatus Neomarinimicrobiota bacterium]MBT3759742.1 cell division protein FtsA [Candidatus Neomarinimicrobiota bacterium]MBT3895852.1 cell division protein FtsA [Candidatus Neomarinimicrobiota bacterium]
MKDENKKIITGIDVGTTKVCVVTAACTEGKPIEILGVGKSPTKGLKKGVVININDTVESIKKAVQQAETQSGIPIESALIGISGEHIRGINNTGVITVSKNSSRNPFDHEITESDRNRVLEHAKSITLPAERRILHVLSQQYKVDNRNDIIDPIGMTGNRLEAKVHLIHSEIASEKNLIACFDKAEIDIIDFVLSPLASAYSVLDPNEKNLGVVLLDIGGGTTDVIVFYNGGIHHTGIIPIGGDTITSDIAHGAQTTIELAEKLKCEYGIAKEALASEDEEISVPGIHGRESKSISRRKLASFIEPRLREIMMFAQSEIRKSDHRGLFTFGIVITGGTAMMKNIEDLASDIFKYDIKVGIPMLSGGISDSIQDPTFSTAAGLIEFAVLNGDKYEEEDGIPGLLKSFSKRIKNLFENLY